VQTTTSRLPVLALAALLAMAAAGAWAQGSTPLPDTHEMIEALKPSTTRSLRNLVVRQKAEGAAAAASAAAASAPALPPAAVATVDPPPSAQPAGAPPSLSLAIQFETNSAQVRPESGPVLGNLVAAMLSPELKGVRFAIEGHSDARGQAAANRQLSQDRAEQVRLYLIALGVHPGRLKAVGKGASDLANPLDPGAPANRRVRVVTLE